MNFSYYLVDLLIVKNKELWDYIQELKQQKELTFY
jgi:hypothetical protein